jgi:hypothetical protein
MSEWQPIESVPRDGTPVLLWGILWPEIWDKVDLPASVVGSYDSTGKLGKMDNTECYSTWVEASHWMPLPPPPSSDVVECQ